MLVGLVGLVNPSLIEGPRPCSVINRASMRPRTKHRSEPVKASSMEEHTLLHCSITLMQRPIYSPCQFTFVDFMYLSG